MKYLSILLMLVFPEVPFKPAEEFEVKLDYKFKERGYIDIKTVYLDESAKDYQRHNSSAILPYLVLHVKVLKLSEDVIRVRVANNLNSNLSTKKIQEGIVIPITVGFTDDAKDRVAAHQYILTFLSAEKKDLNRIVINIEEDGSFFVNGEKRGKF